MALCVNPLKRAVLCLRVSTVDQTTANQERELRDVADRMGCEIVKVYKKVSTTFLRWRDGRAAVILGGRCGGKASLSSLTRSF
jgi:hypothetical protein